MDKINIEFTKDEINTVVTLIDLAVKSLGLQVAESGVFLSKKLLEVSNKTNES